MFRTFILRVQNNMIETTFFKFNKLNFKQINKSHFLLVAVIIFLFVGVIIGSYYYNTRGTPAKVGPQSSDTQVMSKEAVESLVKSAAEKKYIEDVLNATTNLPVPKHPVPLQPAPQSVQPAVTSTSNKAPLAQRCSYAGQLYVAGDMVKTPQTWIRCMPTLIFSGDKSDVQEYGSPAWVVVQ